MESTVCRKIVSTEESCECDECVKQKVDEWLVNRQPYPFHPCRQFQKAYRDNDQDTLDYLQSFYREGRCLCCGYSILHTAITVASKEFVSWYLSRNYDINVITIDGDTELHMACALNDPWFVEQLLSYKAKVDAIDGLGCTPLQICLSHKKPSKAILKMLLDNGAVPSELFKYDEDSVCQIIKVNSRNSAGVLPLYEAVYKNDHVLTRSLLENGACPDSLKGYTRTLLQVACLNGSVLCAKALLEAGVDVNEKDPEGRTALHYAVISNSIDLVVLLAAYNCELWSRDSDGYTALGMAILTNLFEVTTELLKLGVTCKEALLLEALERRCTDAVLALLGYCQFNWQDKIFGKRMLYCAVGTEQHSVVERLLDLGVEVPYEGPDDQCDNEIVELPKVETKKKNFTGALIRRKTGERLTKKQIARRTLKLSDVPRVCSWQPRFFSQYRQIAHECVTDASKFKLHTRQRGSFTSKRITNVTDEESRAIRPKINKKSLPKVKTSFSEISDKPRFRTKHVDSYLKYYGKKESKAKLTTCEGIISKKEISKGTTTTVDNFFKFYEFSVM